MMFIKKGAAENEEMCIECDVFWRAFIFNQLFEMNRKNNIALDMILKEDVDYLTEQKSIYHEYGWSYCKNLKELPPDIDTLSEMIRVYAYSKCESNKEGIYKSIDNAVSYNSNNLNIFGTYIVDWEDKSIENIIIQNMVKDVYGVLPSYEVNANFAYALCCLDSERYKTIILNIIEWLESNILDNGYWESSYYLSQYYCGYIYSKICKRLGRKNHFVQKNLDFVINGQNSDGSWGNTEGCNLDTSFAIISLINYSSLFEISITEKILQGAQYLTETQDTDGWWTGCDFLAFGTGRYDSSMQAMRYRSSILTTSICINALAKVIDYISS